MSEFLPLLSPAQALQSWLPKVPALPVSETISTTEGMGRVCFADLLAPHPLPTFSRSTVDGYAVRAMDTYGASETLPAYLQLTGEVPMGSQPTIRLQTGQCALIHTGGMLPVGADGVIMLEHTQLTNPQEVEILRAIAPGENLVQIGEDIKTGELIMRAGTRLRPAEIGGLLALGITQLQVARPPRVAILSSGDELVPPHAPLHPGQVRDINSHTLHALINQNGGRAVLYDILPDQRSAFRAATQQALMECDIVLFTAGSSVSVRDLTAETIQELGKPGILVHGINIRPGKPTILALCNGKAVLGLPGNPVSALLIAHRFLLPLLEKHLALTPRPRPTVVAHLAHNLPSQAGREDWVPVQLLLTPTGYQAQPILGKSNLIFTLAGADGFVCIPADANGISAGTTVEISLL